MKVLLSAYACEPNKGSEPAVGWNWAVRVARSHEVWVLTRANNRKGIEEALRKRPVPGLHFIYHDLPRWARFWKRGNRGIYLYYLLWQLTALLVVRPLHRKVGFDLGHQVTFVSFRLPSFLPLLGIPYIWGPVGGGERPPLSFYRSFDRGGFLKQLARDGSNAFARFDPLVGLTARRADHILTTTAATTRALPRSVRPKTRVLPAIGIDTPEVSTGCALAKPPSGQPMRILYAGRLVYWKGLHLALEGFAQAMSTQPGISLTIVGDGSARADLEHQARERGIADQVRFVGQLSRKEVLELYCHHDVFIYPSLQDSGGFVVLEAMACGLPVICLDIGGPGAIVTSETGVSIPATTPIETIPGIASAIVRLASDEHLRRAMGEAGRYRALSEYSWDRKSDLISDLYQEIAIARGIDP